MCARAASRWKCLLSAGVLADISVSARAGENRREKELKWGREKAEWKALPIRSIIFCVCVYASVCVIFPASSSCLPSLILSSRSSRLVLPDPISASKCHNQPFVLFSCAYSPLSAGKVNTPTICPLCHFCACQCHTAMDLLILRDLPAPNLLCAWGVS